MRLDFGAIAKGMAADEALKVMQQQHIPCCLVDAGGDLAIGKAPPGQVGWQVHVAPAGSQNGTLACLLLAGCGVATSSDAARGCLLTETISRILLILELGKG